MTSSREAPGGTRATYEIVVRGELSDHFVSTFLDESFVPAGLERRDGTTVIVVEVIDQGHLLGILERLRDLAIEIERVNLTSANQETTDTPAT